MFIVCHNALNYISIKVKVILKRALICLNLSFKYIAMKKLNIRFGILTLLAAMILSCSSQNQIRGSAADRTGTNGATNGTGKIPKSL